MIKQNRPRRSRTPGDRPRSKARAELRERDLVIPLAFRTYRGQGPGLRTLANHQVRAAADDARAGRLHRAERTFDAAAKELRSFGPDPLPNARDLRPAPAQRAVSLARLELYRAKGAQLTLGAPVTPHFFAMREPKTWPHPGSCTSPRRAAKRAAALVAPLRPSEQPRLDRFLATLDTGRTSLRGDMRSNLPKSGVREVAP